MERVRVTVQIKPQDKQKIEEAIRKEYPKFKNTSDVIRKAIEEFLAKEEGVCV